MTETEIAVIGGGLVGMAVAYGLQRRCRQVTVFDEGDVAFRASRGNFGLVWVQGKGATLPDYARCHRALDAPAEHVAHVLHPVADPEHGNVQLEDARVAGRRVLLVDARRTAGEDDPLRPLEPLGVDRVRHDLAVAVVLAHPPRDQLRVLRAEVEDIDGFVIQRLIR